MSRWLTFFTLLFVFTVHGQVIKEVEYFIDTDPGYGNGTQFAFDKPDSTFLLLNQLIPTTGLNVGFHVLYIRAKADFILLGNVVDEGNGTLVKYDTVAYWGAAEQRIFYLDEAGDIILISGIEAYFDRDPGYGSGINIGDFIQGTTIGFAYEFQTDTLSEGFHVLYVRAQSQDGNWGITEQRLVFIDRSGVLDSVAYLEGFIDIDPGFGNGFALGTFDPDLVVTGVDQIQTDSSLSVGFHTLYVRARSTGGEWGMLEQRLVYLDEAGGLSLLSNAEVFFDVDPGYGKGLPISGIEPNLELSLQSVLATDTISEGFHVLFVRVQTEEGIWGFAEQRLVYVDLSGVIDPVSYVEVFFDSDPGYGAGISIGEFDTGLDVQILEAVATDSLLVGFHTLYLRVQTSGGQWGIAEQRLVYVDNSGTGLANIVELEYFIDVDPGYDLATSIPISTPDIETVRNFMIGTASLTPGKHVLVIRPKDEYGTWGMPETFEFQAFDPGRELDSLSLRVLYDAVEGANWTSRTNWLTTIIDNWYGVGVEGGRVTSLDLSNNNLTGKLPFQLGYLSSLKSLNLGSNLLGDTIPSTFVELTSMEALVLNENQFHEIPNLSVIPTLASLDLSNNLFDFRDLEPMASVSNFLYSPQMIYGDAAFDSIIKVGVPYVIDVDIRGQNNEYQWQLNEANIPGADLRMLQIPAFMATDTGKYQLVTTNPLLPELTMQSARYGAHLSQFEEDSLAMVSLYLSTGGENWQRKTGWLSSPFTTWEGLGFTNERLTAISLSNNGLEDSLPEDLFYADLVNSLDIASNQLSGRVPDTYIRLKQLTQIRMSENDIRGIPSFSTVSSLNTLDVRNNRIQFADLEGNLNVSNLLVSPQKPVTENLDTLVERTSTPAIAISISGSNNQYQWFKDGEILAGETASELKLENVDFDDEGIYSLQATNSLVTGLTLTSGELALRVTSLRRDSIALRTLYDATNGDNWNPAVNWINDPIREWERVVVESDRVTSVDLANLNVAGAIPRDIRDVTSLVDINLKNNRVTVLPNMSQMSNLELLDASDNFLGPDAIEPNLTLQGFVFKPQKEIPIEQPLLVADQGTDVRLTFEIGGAKNEYEWFFNESFIPGAFSMDLLIDSIGRDKMGFYIAEVTSPRIRQADPDFRIVRQPQQVLAKAAISGVVQGLGGELLPTGELDVFLIPETTGKFDTVQTVDIVNGEFTANDLILADYTLLAKTEDGFYIPTYYGDSEDWVTARTINLIENFPVTSYNMLFRPDDPTGGEGNVDLTVESEIDGGDGSSRVETRRRVRKAGCSLRRRTTGGGRPENDGFVLFAYRETDDNGQVAFGTLPIGEYRLNIQYPGIPMDPNSFVQFEITEEEADKQFVLNAVVTEDAIVVELIEALSTFRKYFDNLKVYPNPTTDILAISYNKLNVSHVSAKLYDINGREVASVNLVKGRNQKLEMDVTTLNNGIYLLHIYDRKETEGDQMKLATFKVIIRHQ